METDNKFKKCDYYKFASIDLNSFLSHIKEAYYTDNKQVKIPLIDLGNNRKYSSMEYDVSISSVDDIPAGSLGKKQNLTS